MSASTSPRTRHPLPIALGAIAVVAVLGGLVWAIVALATASNAPARPAVAESVLPDTTSMGAVELVTDDLAPMRSYYVDGVGLEVLDETAERLSLGVDGVELVAIRLADGLPADDIRQAGLYHTAILFPDRPSLATAILRVAELQPTSFQGSADHRVSEAFYFGDPDGNGVELYVDRPRDEWEWADGRVTMGSLALDPNAFVAEHLGGATAGTPIVGHLHLRVGDLDASRAFYEGVLGFAVTSEAEGAVFFAAGGYHHHIATNTWSSPGAGERDETLGLGSVTVVLGDTAAVDALVERAEAAGVAVEPIDGGVLVRDPWGTAVRILA